MIFFFPYLTLYIFFILCLRAAIAETIFLVYFWCEYLLRLFVARGRKKFCARQYWSLLFVVVLTAEYIVVLVRNGKFIYDPWGIAFLERTPRPFRVDPHSLRVLRILVPARFVYITSDFKGIQNLKTTMWRVASRLVPFIFMFSICFVQLTFFMYYAEIMQCKPVQVSDGEGSLVWRYMRANEVDDCKIQDMIDSMWVIIVTLTSVGYGGRFPQSSAGKGVAVVAALFGLFAQAMPLTIIGNTFYNIHIEQERKRQKLHGRFKLRKAVFKCTDSMVMYHHDDEDTLIESGFEELSKSMRMKNEHHIIVDQYLDIKRDNVHAMQTSAQMKEFSDLHDQVLKIVSLYLHTSDASMVMKKQEEIARRMVEENMEGMDQEQKNHRQTMVLSTFKHLSSRYIDGASFHEIHEEDEEEEDNVGHQKWNSRSSSIQEEEG